MIDLWNALPDSIHYAGMALLDASSVLHTLVTLWSWLSGHTLFEDGSIGTYAAVGLMLGTSPTATPSDDPTDDDDGEAEASPTEPEPSDQIAAYDQAPSPATEEEGRPVKPALRYGDPIAFLAQDGDAYAQALIDARARQWEVSFTVDGATETYGTPTLGDALTLMDDLLADRPDGFAVAKDVYKRLIDAIDTPTNTTHGIGYDPVRPRSYATISTPADWEPYPALVECPDCDYGEAGYVEHTTRDGVFWPVGTCETCKGSGYVWERGDEEAS